MEIPTRIGKYRIIKKLGQGASGCVVKAEHNVIHRIISLKILFSDLIKAKPNLIKRFRREARLAAALVHPNIVPIFEIGEAEELHFYTMQYVDGLPMTAYVRQDLLTLEEKISVFIQICDAVGLAHSRDIIHRDLKPQNVIIVNHETPMILDFGIAKSLVDDEQMTQAGHILGSAHYMAPEQARSRKVGAYTDVFCLGVMMYEMFTKQRPFRGSNVKELILGRLKYGEEAEKYAPIPMQEINSEIPETLDKIVFKCIEADPQKRYATAGEVRDDLQEFLKKIQLHNIVASKETSQKTLKRPINKKTSYVYPFLLSFFIFLLGLSAVIWLYWGQGVFPALDPYLQFLKALEKIEIDFLLKWLGI